MKKLIFVRHGKAEDLANEFSDFERSLTPKGKNIALVMARRFMEKENSPGTIITSPAFRALETALIFAGELRIRYDKIIMNSDLYDKCNYSSFHEMISELNEETDTITLFGHNPSFSEITNILCIEGCDIMPKCGVVGIKFNIKIWPEMKRNTGKLEYYLKPE